MWTFVLHLASFFIHTYSYKIYHIDSVSTENYRVSDDTAATDTNYNDLSEISTELSASGVGSESDLSSIGDLEVLPIETSTRALTEYVDEYIFDAWPTRAPLYLRLRTVSKEPTIKIKIDSPTQVERSQTIYPKYKLNNTRPLFHWRPRIRMAGSIDVETTGVKNETTLANVFFWEPMRYSPPNSTASETTLLLLWHHRHWPNITNSRVTRQNLTATRSLSKTTAMSKPTRVSTVKFTTTVKKKETLTPMPTRTTKTTKNHMPTRTKFTKIVSNVPKIPIKILPQIFTNTAIDAYDDLQRRTQTYPNILHKKSSTTSDGVKIIDISIGGGLTRPKNRFTKVQKRLPGQFECYQCDDTPHIPDNTDCHDLVNLKKCKTKIGCYKRFLDVGANFDKRGCVPNYSNRSKRDARFGSLEKMHLRMIRNKELAWDECILSPVAVVTDYGSGVKIPVHYHSCLCRGHLCNGAVKLVGNYTYAVVLILLFIY